MAKKQKVEEFITTALGSSGPMATIILLIDKAIILIKEMKENPESRSNNSRRVRNILAQLQMALNYTEGRDTVGLFTLYDYLYQEMQIADDLALDSAEKLLIQLRTTFKELKKRIIIERR